MDMFDIGYNEQLINVINKHRQKMDFTKMPTTTIKENNPNLGFE